MDFPFPFWRLCESNFTSFLTLETHVWLFLEGPPAPRRLPRRLLQRPLFDFLTRGVKKGRFVILRVPLFYSIWGLKIPRRWEKQHEKCHCHTPSCVPQMLAKVRTWEQCPQMLAGKTRAKWQLDPFLPIQGGGVLGEEVACLGASVRWEDRTRKDAGKQAELARGSKWARSSESFASYSFGP